MGDIMRTIFLGETTSQAMAEYDQVTGRIISLSQYPISPWRKFVNWITGRKDSGAVINYGETKLPFSIILPDLDPVNRILTGKYVNYVFADLSFNNGSYLLQKVKNGAFSTSMRLKAAEFYIAQSDQQLEEFEDIVGKGNKDNVYKHALDLLEKGKQLKKKLSSYNPYGGGKNE
jgi:hypothetical protein